MPMVFVSARKIAMGIVCLVIFEFNICIHHCLRVSGCFLALRKHSTIHPIRVWNSKHKGEAITVGQGLEIPIARWMSLTEVFSSFNLAHGSSNWLLTGTSKCVWAPRRDGELRLVHLLLHQGVARGWERYSLDGMAWPQIGCKSWSFTIIPIFIQM